MTINPKIQPNLPQQDRVVVFIAFPNVGLLDLTGAQTVFWAASNYMQQLGLPGYSRYTASLNGGLVTSVEGVTLETIALKELANTKIDTIMVPGSPNIVEVLANSKSLVDWLQTASIDARRVASVCSGAFLLAKAGLLEGKQAVTHWALCDLLKEHFPAIKIERDAIFIQQDSIWTSAGVTAGIDLALALVEADCGRDIAMKVARELVVYLKRPGGQAQFSELLQTQVSNSDEFDALHLWISKNLNSQHLTVEYLAQKATMSPRNFSRVYKQITGRTPAKAVEIFRLEAARRLLEDSALNIDQIAEQCGFGDEERMRVTFHRNLTVSPTDYRKRFSR